MFDRAELEARIPPAEAVKLVSSYLTYITQTNDNMIDQQKKKPTRFHAKQIPSIDILGCEKNLRDQSILTNLCVALNNLDIYHES